VGRREGTSANPGVEVDDDLDIHTSFDVHILLAGNRERIARNGAERIPARFEADSETAVLSRHHTCDPLTVTVVDIDGGLVGEIGTGVLLGLDRALGSQENQAVDTLRSLGAQQRVAAACREKQHERKPGPRP
jgi:hypothetical protein